MAPHSSTLAWKIPWTKEPGGLQSMGSLRVGHDWANSLSLFTFMHWRRKWQPTPVFLPGESQGRQSLVGCRLRGHTESDTTEATWQQQHSGYKWHGLDSSISSFLIHYYGFSIPDIQLIRFATLSWSWNSLNIKMLSGFCLNIASVCALCMSDSATPWTVAHKDPLSMEFSRQEFWSRLPFPPLRNIHYPDIKAGLWCLLHWQADSLLLIHQGSLFSI